MIFAKPNKVVPNIVPLLRDTTLEHVNEFNFLGVLIDKGLTWKPHINRVANRISRCSGIISRFKHFFPKTILLNIYNALFTPHLNYGILIWGFMSTTRLLTIQKKCVRSISNVHCFTHAQFLFKKLKILQVDDIFLSMLLKFYFKLMNDLQPYYFNAFKPKSESHSFNLRLKRFENVSTKKVYCDNCVRFGLIKLIKSIEKPSSSIDDSIYETNFKYNKLLSKPSFIIKCIIAKVHTHSYMGFCNYIKIRFIELYE